MSYDNQDFTLHQLHDEFNPNCEYCDEIQSIRKFRYETELRKCWIDMVETYPQHYSIDDYFQACKRTGIPIF